MWLASGLLLLVVCAAQVHCRLVVHYVGAVEVDWDYAPDGNRVTNDTTFSTKYITRSADRIGSTYKKIIYRPFMDATFSVQKTTPPELGFLGPTMYAEAGDTIEVVFKNMAWSANRNLSMHPHGAHYDKDDEGALYIDNTTGKDKEDDGIPPGETYRYKWTVPESFAPERDDDACLPWAYHSHINAVKDVDSGLVGMLLTCKRGTLGPDGNRTDVASEFPIYVDITDENESWLFTQNLHKCQNPDLCKQYAASANSGFVASNQMAHINGYVYGNLKGLKVPIDDKPSVFYFFSINRAMTGMHISGQVFSVNKHSKDSVNLFPATFVSAFMSPSHAGVWLMASRNDKPYMAGQMAFVEIKRQLSLNQGLADSLGFLPFNKPMRPVTQSQDDWWLNFMGKDFFRRQVRGSSHSSSLSSSSSSDRQYYLQIENHYWDYGPSEMDLYNGGSLTAPGSYAEKYFGKSKYRIGSKYKKAHYVQYTNSEFCTRMAHTEADDHLGMLGPVLLAEEGETVKVTVKNTAGRPYTFLPHGVTFNKCNEGYVYMNPKSGEFGGRVVAPGKTVVYRFKVPELGEQDLPCVVRSYLSAVDPVKDVNTGLVGPMLLCRKGQLGPHPKLPWMMSARREEPSPDTWFNQHQHIFLNFLTFDENFSWYLEENINIYSSFPSAVDPSESVFHAANRKHAVNGRMFGNLFGMTMCRGDKIAWHMFGAEGQPDMHGIDFQGQTLVYQENHVSAKVVIPGTTITLTSVPESVGNWSLVCRTNSHFLTGMLALYEVKTCDNRPPHLFQMTGEKRTYYIAAQEVVWDYAPLPRDPITGNNITSESDPGYLYLKDTPEFIGSKYKKARYLEYTDATFATLKPRPAEQKHMGILGPVIHAEVGDVIEVVFFNNASRPYSIHPQGVHYDKANEGARYADGASGFLGNSVPPGEKYTYVWEVPASAGPGDNDFSCVPWLYFSAVNSVKDMNTGLVGPLLICKDGILNVNGTPSDVDRQFWMLYFVFDENFSWYLADNIAERAPNQTNPNNKAFKKSNQMNAINGLVFGNVEGMVMDEGDVVNWYLLGLGASKDFHPVHFHGQTFSFGTLRIHRGDVMDVYPATSTTVRMKCDNPGTWLVHCHFADHVKAGMEATYTIQPK